MRWGVQAVITLKPTAGVAGAENAVTSTGNVTGALFVGTMNADPPIKADPPSVEAIPVCEDGVCSPGEPRVKGQPDGDAVCMEDCPLMLGQCDAPGSLDLGDETLPCGGPGFGICDLATLTCDCYKGYAGPACNWCDDGYVRNGDACEVQVRMLESPETEAPAPAPGNNLNGTDSRVRCPRLLVVAPACEARALRVRHRDRRTPSVQGSSDRVDGDGGSSDDAGLIAGLTLMCVVIVAIAGGAFWAFKTGRIGGGGNNSDQYVADVNSAGACPHRRSCPCTQGRVPSECFLCSAVHSSPSARRMPDGGAFGVQMSERGRAKLGGDLAGTRTAAACELRAGRQETWFAADLHAGKRSRRCRDALPGPEATCAAKRCVPKPRRLCASVRF